MDKIFNFFTNIKNQQVENLRQENKYLELQEAKIDLENCVRMFNEVTDSSYVDIAIMQMNLAKKRFDVLIEEAKKDCQELQKVN